MRVSLARAAGKTLLAAIGGGALWLAVLHTGILEDEAAPLAAKKGASSARLRGQELVALLPRFAAREAASYEFEVQGTVKPFAEFILRARVAGRVHALHPAFKRGGHVRSGEQLWHLDASDLKTRKRLAAARLIEVERNLELERDRGAAAEREWKLLAEVEGTAEVSEEMKRMIRRLPQIEAAEARVVSARAELRLREIDLERACERAPFDGIVHSEELETGSWIERGAVLGSLISSDHCLVDAAVPVADVEYPIDPAHARARVSLWGVPRAEERAAASLAWLADGNREDQMRFLQLELRGEDVFEQFWIGARVRVRIEKPLPDRSWAVPPSVLAKRHRDGSLCVIAIDENEMVAIMGVVVVERSPETYYLRVAVEEGRGLVLVRDGAHALALLEGES